MVPDTRSADPSDGGPSLEGPEPPVDVPASGPLVARPPAGPAEASSVTGPQVGAAPAAQLAQNVALWPSATVVVPPLKVASTEPSTTSRVSTPLQAVTVKAVPLASKWLTPPFI